MPNLEKGDGSQKNRTFAPAGAGFNLDQFKNEVASEIGLSLGNKGFAGQSATQSAGQFASQSTFNQQTGFGSQSAYSANYGAQASTGAPSSLGGLSSGAAGTYAQQDFEISSTLGEKKPSAANKVARQRGAKPSGTP